MTTSSVVMLPWPEVREVIERARDRAQRELVKAEGLQAVGRAQGAVTLADQLLALPEMVEALRKIKDELRRAAGR